MGHKLDCNVVQDLLPSYIEGLTSDLTTSAIEEHLSSCSNCKKELATMTNEVQPVDKATEKQINFLKKIKRRQWIIASISVLVAITIFAGVVSYISQRQFPVPSSQVTISDVYQMKDGSIHYRISTSVKGYLGNVTATNDGNSDIFRLYEHRRFSPGQSASSVALPERWVNLRNPGSTGDITAIFYEGRGKGDRIVIWEKGMTLPQASAEQEAAYEQNVVSKR
ncbi:zf-HC2 domain-containing protein [Paenibacillus cymbidii]|uniref:zf-HC2 domain-containing protein n=1 Tax=Paenibacillus cymbidii TaxID=1639034 RepID=UPI001081BDEA|nr:zf-HC2 domain-containing protein [Paenibacillus cymbidii]